MGQTIIRGMTANASPAHQDDVDQPYKSPQASSDLPQHLTSELPTLYQDRSFWGMTVTQLLGAFNDNLFKQLVLLLAVGGAVAAAGENPPTDRQGEAMFVFALPFLLFSGVAGFLSDRTSKTRIVVAAKVAEICVMAMGVTAFAFYASSGLIGAFAVLFLMGTQSAFFGPAKYGILPEMLRRSDLPRANGIFLMTTFVAIILGTAAAGFLKGQDLDRLWISALACVAIAALGTATSLLVRRVPAALPGLKFERSTVTIPPDMRQLLRSDPVLLKAVLVVSLFWLVGGLVQPTVNAVGILQLKIGDQNTSIMAACMALGIACGCLLAGRMCHGYADFRLVRVGSWGMVVCMVLLSLPAVGGLGDQQANHLLGFAFSAPLLLAAGVFAGLFVVPLQVVLQSRPPEGKKGRMIAVMNICSWMGILISAVLYKGAALIIEGTGLPQSSVFAVPALILLPVAMFYRPRTE